MDFKNVPPEMVPALLGALDNQIMQLTYVRKVVLEQFQAAAAASQGTKAANDGPTV